MRALIVLVALTTFAFAESEAERYYNQGQAAYDNAQYDDALTAWQKSYQLSKLPGLLFNIAQAQRLRAKPGDCTQAVANYKKFIQLQPKSSERPTAEGFLAELGSCDRDKPPPVIVTPPEAVTPPAITAPLQQPPLRESGGGGRGKRFAGYALGGAGALLVVTGVYFGAKARRLGNEVSDECADGCDWNLVKDKDAEGKSAETTQYILYGVGAGALVVGGVLWWMGHSESKSSSVAVTPTAGGAAVSWGGAW
jgi:tetratricopeptide (TPR) repeat protein